MILPIGKLENTGLKSSSKTQKAKNIEAHIFPKLLQSKDGTFLRLWNRCAKKLATEVVLILSKIISRTLDDIKASSLE